LTSQPDYVDSAPILQRYNSKAAALYRDKVMLLLNEYDCRVMQETVVVINKAYSQLDLDRVPKNKEQGLNSLAFGAMESTWSHKKSKLNAVKIQ